jgi:spore coat polysaccharide biosynthesis protein SpsF
MTKVVGIIQARMGSTRLPGKALADVSGQPLLATMIERVHRALTLDAVWVATTENEHDEPIVDLALASGAGVFRGSEDDVLTRYVGAARAAGADVVVRLTSDCPLLDPAVIDRVVGELDGFDLATNAPPADRTYPDGMDVEVLTIAALERAEREATAPEDREHVTRYLHRGDFSVHAVHLDRDLGDVRITVDTADDLELVAWLLRSLPPGFTLDHVLRALGQ